MAKKDKLEKIKPNNLEVNDYDFIICPNCGAEEVGKFCPNCGQSNKDFNKPLKEIGGDLLDSINLDIRLINTLIPFFTKPGFLTQEYFNGKRKRYVPPMRMYMFFSILFFFLVQYMDTDKRNDLVQVEGNISLNDLSLSLSKDVSDSLDISDQIIKMDIDTLSNKGEFLMNGLSPKVITQIDIDTLSNKDDVVINGFSAKDREKIITEVSKDTSTPAPIKEAIIGGMNAFDKKEMFIDKFFKYLSYVLFLLMPVFALILAMILWKSRKLYVHHLIFSINFHSFIFGFSSVMIILDKIIPESISEYLMYLWWGIPIYLLIGIIRFYKRKLVGAFFKVLGSLFIYILIISIVLLAITVYIAKEFYV